MNIRTEKHRLSTNAKKNPLARRTRGEMVITGKNRGIEFGHFAANKHQSSHTLIFWGYFRNVTAKVMRNKYCRI